MASAAEGIVSAHAVYASGETETIVVFFPAGVGE